MSCELLVGNPTTVRLNKLTRTEQTDPKYSLVFSSAIPVSATRFEFSLEGNTFSVLLGCAEITGSTAELAEMPLGWMEDVLPCGVTITATVSFYECTTDPCCGGGEAIEMPEDTDSVYSTDPEFIGGSAVAPSA